MEYLKSVKVLVLLVGLVLILPLGFQNCAQPLEDTPVDQSSLGAVILSTSNANVVKDVGESVSFSVNARGSNLGFLWTHDGAQLDGENSNSLDLNNLAVSDSGNYRVFVFDSNSSTDTADFSLVVGDANAALALSPSNAHDFGAVEVGSSGLQTFTLTNNSTLTITNIVFQTLSEAYQYSTNQCGSNLPPAQSCTFDVVFQPVVASTENFSAFIDYQEGTDPTIKQIALSLTGIGQDQAVDPNFSIRAHFGTNLNTTDKVIINDQSASINSTVNGGPAVSYQWQKRGAGGVFSDLADATGPTHTTSSAGYYRVKAYTANGAEAISNNVEVKYEDIEIPDKIDRPRTPFIAKPTN